MRLASDEHAAVEARRFARSWATGHAVPRPIVDDIELVVSELVTNALRHGEPPIDVELSKSTDGTIRGEICDRSTALPATNPAPGYRGGFGLRIVEARTTRWGSTTQPNGKQVWFEIK